MTIEDSNTINNKPNGGKSTKKNFSVISITFILIFTSYNAATNLQSSTNTDGNVGLYSLAIISGCSVFSCLFLTNPIIFLAGYKWTIFIAQIGFLLFVAANIYPKVWLMYPTSAVCGIFQAAFWTAQSAYIADLGKTDKIGEEEAKENKYFGIFYATFQTSEVWGDLITYLVLRNGRNDSIQKDINLCGANYLESEEQSLSDGSNEISLHTASILYGIFVGLIVISLFLVALFLDQKRHLKQSESKGFISDSFKYTTSTLKQLKKPKQILLLPLAFWIGVSEAFMWSTFITGFITCSVGIQYIGLVMMVYGIAASIFSIIVGYVGKFHRRSLIFVIASIVCYGSLITMLLWKPYSSQMYVLYILAILQGLASAIWDPVVSALYETVFPKEEEAAFSSMWLGENTGHLVVYLYAGSLRARTSIILQIIYLTIALIGYFILDIKQTYQQKKLPPVALANVAVIETQ
ncbi:unnamed protein product [Rotaria sp. Silwood1]|nr:unnamed protein product [Rotaria sp. Silwood1]